ncbi:MAG TPA: dTMP kinase [Alphaproteobacteria bacterium]|nr:dTMP kinase [Alphaproteobacteria bacterium]
MASTPRGRLITLEGGEGAGKSTQARRLAEWLRQRGVAVELTREPGGSPGAEEIRALLVTGEPGRWDPLSELMLHYAARRDHMVRTIVPTLDAGRWVVCDRFIDSTLAYQGYGLGIPIDTITGVRRAVMGDFEPDLTLILDVDLETGRERTASRAGGEDRYERMGAAFHARIREGFRKIAADEPNRCVIVPTGGPVDEVAATIAAAVDKRFGLVS